MKQKKIVVSLNEDVKSGVSQSGRAWTLSKVTDQDGDTYTTFNGGRYPIGVFMAVNYEEESNGRFVNRKLIEDNKAKAFPVQKPVPDKLAELEKRIAALERYAGLE